MALLDVNWKPGQRELRQFSLIWIGFFGLIGLYFYFWKHETTAATVLGVVAACGLVGLALPSVFRPIYLLWMAFALPIGWTISHLILLILYYVIMTPIGLLMRAVGYDPMERQFDRAAKSYWVPREMPKDNRQYFKQF